ncbi:hypothetical protein NQ318_004201 [Aromia moschata]|uniref:Putative inorganic phosphate cotransporter n=1 Tax=Aromia moschata TaxID=1265417 RepID=A0AAV8Y793_9CUCU|nr:hypothetical protein NQ318_004201 [Aromia moschata]
MCGTVKDENVDTVEVANKGPAFGKRHVHVVLMFFLTGIAYTMRVNLSVAIVAMTDNTTSPNPDIPTYDWNDKSVVLSSFYWSYILLQIYAGKLGAVYGIKWFLVGTMAIDSVAFTSIPFFAEKFGSKGVMGCRIVQGLAQGFIYPSLAVILGQWAPLSERATMVAISMSGFTISNVVAMPIAGYICGSWYGWPMSFYVFGLLGVAWIIPWVIFGHNSPAEHKSITTEERTYIQRSVGYVESQENIRTPWKAILTSVPVWAYVIACYGSEWGFSTLLTEMPTYIDKIMKFDIQSNSWLSAAPYACLIIITWTSGFFSDYLINSGYISLPNGRKLFSTIALLGSGIALIVLAYIPETATALSIALLTATIGLGGTVTSGFSLNNIDLSPTFAGVITGFANSFCNVGSILAPLFVQFVVTDETDKLQWRIVFLVAAGISIASNVFYLAFTTTEVQWWNFPIGYNEKGEQLPVSEAIERQKSCRQYQK